MNGKDDPNEKRGSNPGGSTSPADVARLVAHIRRNAAKKRKPKGGKDG